MTAHVNAFVAKARRLIHEVVMFKQVISRQFYMK